MIWETSGQTAAFFLVCSFQYLLQTNPIFLEQFSFWFFSVYFVWVPVMHLYSSPDSHTLEESPLYFIRKDVFSNNKESINNNPRLRYVYADIAFRIWDMEPWYMNWSNFRGFLLRVKIVVFTKKKCIFWFASQRKMPCTDSYRLCNRDSALVGLFARRTRFV